MRPDPRPAPRSALRPVRPILLLVALLAGRPAAANPPPDPLGGAHTVTLDNGLTVVLREDRSRPVVAVQMYYSVGARNETTGITGIAHFVEHMLFRGTESFGLADITGVIERAGGEWHGYTWLDGTTYFEAAPRDLLPTLLRLEAERMTRARMAPGEVDPERGAVFQEYRGYQIDPRSDLFDAVQEVLFLQHPYRNNTMGWESDLAGITPADLAAFYRRFYGPRNAVLAIAGDFDTEDALARVRSAFAAIPAGGDDTSIRTVEPEPAGPRRVTLVRSGAEPALVVSFPGPPASPPRRFAALAVLDAILAHARGLSFYHHSGDQITGGTVDPFARLAPLVAGGPAATISTAFAPTRCPGHYSISATPRDGAAIADLEGAVFDALAEAAQSIGDDEVARARRLIAAADLLETDSPLEVAHELAFWTSLGGPGLRAAILDAVRDMTAAEVRAVAAGLVPRRAVIGVLLPPAMPAGRMAGISPGTEDAVRPRAARQGTALPAHPATGAGGRPSSLPAFATRATVSTRRLAWKGRGAGGLGAGRVIVDARPGLPTFVLRLAFAPSAEAIGGVGVARLRAVAAILAADDLARAGTAASGVMLDIEAPGDGRFDERDTLQVEAAGPAAAWPDAIASLRAAVGRALRTSAAATGPPAARPGARAVDILDAAVAEADRSPLAPGTTGGSPRGDAHPPALRLQAAVVGPFDGAAIATALGALAAVADQATRDWARPAEVPSRTDPASAAIVPFAPGLRTASLPGVPQGRLLIAIPGESDPVLQDAVAWLLHHNYSGRLGVRAIAETGLVYEMESESARRGPPLALFSMGADPDRLGRLATEMEQVLAAAAAGFTGDEVASFRTFASGRAAVRLAHPDQAARLWASVLLRGGDHETPARDAARAAALDRDGIAAAAARMLDPARRLVIQVGRAEPAP
jgi:zinc protease